MLDAMQRLGTKTNTEILSIQDAVGKSNVTALSAKSQTYLKNLEAFGQEAHDLENKFLEKRESGEWQYYSRQMNYVVGDNPDNLGLNSISNAVSPLTFSLTRWSSLDESGRAAAIGLLNSPISEAQTKLQIFFKWENECHVRITTIRQRLN